jgi:hypothetical protein
MAGLSQRPDSVTSLPKSGEKQQKTQQTRKCLVFSKLAQLQDMVYMKLMLGADLRLTHEDEIRRSNTVRPVEVHMTSTHGAHLMGSFCYCRGHYQAYFNETCPRALQTTVSERDPGSIYLCLFHSSKESLIR